MANKESKTPKIDALASVVYNKMNEGQKRSLVDPLVNGAEAFMRSAIENPYTRDALYDYVSDIVGTTFSDSATAKNPFTPFYKGMAPLGMGKRQIFVDMIEAHAYNLPLNLSKEECSRYIVEALEAVFSMNYHAIYEFTRDTFWMDRVLTSEIGISNFGSTFEQSMEASKIQDHYLTIVALLAKAYTSNALNVVTYDPSDPDNFVTTLRTVSDRLEFPSPEANSLGVRSSTPKDRQHIVIPAAVENYYNVKVLSAAFNLSYADYDKKRIKIKDTFDVCSDPAKYEALRAANPNLPTFSAEEVEKLKMVDAFVLDERFLEWITYRDTVTMKRLESRDLFTIRNFYDGCFMLNPFYNAIAIVKEEAAPTVPETLNGSIIAKSIDSTGVKYTVVVSDPTGNAISPSYIVPNADSNENGLLVIRNGFIIVPNDATSTIGAANAYAKYTSSTVTTALNVGDTITFTKD